MTIKKNIVFESNKTDFHVKEIVTASLIHNPNSAKRQPQLIQTINRITFQCRSLKTLFSNVSKA